jgi:hypothetical protein
MRVTIDGVWIGNLAYSTLTEVTTSNYSAIANSYTTVRSVTNAVRISNQTPKRSAYTNVTPVTIATGSLTVCFITYLYFLSLIPPAFSHILFPVLHIIN